MVTAKYAVVVLETVTDDGDAAMLASWRQQVNGTFEAVKRIRIAV